VTAKHSRVGTPVAAKHSRVATPDSPKSPQEAATGRQSAKSSQSMTHVTDDANGDRDTEDANIAYYDASKSLVGDYDASKGSIDGYDASKVSMDNDDVAGSAVNDDDNSRTATPSPTKHRVATPSVTQHRVATPSAKHEADARAGKINSEDADNDLADASLSKDIAGVDASEADIDAGEDFEEVYMQDQREKSRKLSNAHSPIVSQPHSRMVSQPQSPTASKPPSATASKPHSPRASQPHSPIPAQPVRSGQTSMAADEIEDEELNIEDEAEKSVVKASRTGSAHNERKGSSGNSASFENVSNSADE